MRRVTGSFAKENEVNTVPCRDRSLLSISISRRALAIFASAVSVRKSRSRRDGRDYSARPRNRCAAASPAISPEKQDEETEKVKGARNFIYASKHTWQKRHQSSVLGNCEHSLNLTLKASFPECLQVTLAKDREIGIDGDVFESQIPILGHIVRIPDENACVLSCDIGRFDDLRHAMVEVAGC